MLEACGPFVVLINDADCAIFLRNLVGVDWRSMDIRALVSGGVPDKRPQDKRPLRQKATERNVDIELMEGSVC